MYRQGVERTQRFSGMENSKGNGLPHGLLRDGPLAGDGIFITHLGKTREGGNRATIKYLDTRIVELSCPIHQHFFHLWELGRFMFLGMKVMTEEVRVGALVVQVQA